MSTLQSILSNRTLFLRYCTIILACAAGFAAILNTFDAWNLASLPYEMNYEEGNILNSALRILHGLSPYPDPHVFPNALNPYGPIFYYLIAVVVRFGGVQLFFPRVVVMLCAIVSAALIGLLVRRHSHSLPLAAAAGCLFLTSKLTYFWMPVLRVDLVGLAFVLIGLYLFSAGLSSWSVPLFVAAIFVKVSLLAGPAACITYLVLHRQWKRAAWFAGAGISLSVICFFVAQRLSGGWFSFHIFKTHADPFSWHSVFSYLWGMAQLDFPLLFPAICYIALKIRERDFNLPTLYLLFTVVGTVTTGKLGSDSNHLLELHAALTLCAALGVATLAERIPSQRVALVVVAVAIALLVFYSEENPRIVNERAMMRDCGQVYGFVHGVQGEVLSDNIGLLVLTGKPVFISNPFVYRYLVTKDGWSDQELQQKVSSQGFAAIVLSSDPTTHPLNESYHWSAQVLDNINRAYRPIGHFQCTEATSILLPVKRGG
jgi:hypothetical protein